MSTGKCHYADEIKSVIDIAFIVVSVVLFNSLKLFAI